MRTAAALSLGVTILGLGAGLPACASPPGGRGDLPGAAPPGVPVPPGSGSFPGGRGGWPEEASCEGGSGGDRGGGCPDGRRVAGWTAGGKLCVFGSATGVVLAEGEGAGRGGERAPGVRDVAVDPWLSRIVTFERGAGGVPGEPGEVASHALGGAGSRLSLGERRHEAWVEGGARLAASPFGVIVFEEGVGGGDVESAGVGSGDDGGVGAGSEGVEGGDVEGGDVGSEDGNGPVPRWRLLPADGAGSVGVPGPPPASLGTALLPDGRLRISALAYGPPGGAADMFVALVAPGGLGEPVAVPLPVSPVSSSSARWVESAGGGQIVDVSGGDVVVSTFAGSGWPPLVPAGVGPGIERIEQAVSFASGTRLALLTSGAANVVVVTLGAGGAPQCSAALDLPGEPEKAGPFFTRGLAPVGPDRLMVATSSGVLAVTISGDCPPVLAVDPGFDGGALRGPLEVLP